MMYQRIQVISLTAVLVVWSWTAGVARAQEAGSFEATVELSSQAPVEMSGFCISSPHGDAWTAQMVTPGGGSTILFLFAGSSLPSPGEYPIADFVGNDAQPPDNEFIATGSTEQQVFAVTGFHSVKGKLVVTTSSSESVEGTFTFSAREAGEGGRMVSVNGSFTSHNKGG